MLINRNNGKSIDGEYKNLNEEDKNRQQRAVEYSKPSNSLPWNDFKDIISNIERRDEWNMPPEWALEEFARARKNEYGA